MSEKYDGIKTQKFGVEIECTGLTRRAAANAIAMVLGNPSEYIGGSYDKYTVRDNKDRKWSVVYDSSI
ncbi:MAG: amidoligase family protein, partial [Oscillospiraceae bacterium]|nr:amidoligase family protein [Oscillospiraceae bacterium]